MASIALDRVTVDFPIYSSGAKSLRTRLMKFATGGRIGEREDGRIVVRALEDLTLSVKDGDRVGLIGNNGAGKTTLLRVLRGVYYPVGGTLRVQGRDRSSTSPSASMRKRRAGRTDLRGAIMGRAAPRSGKKPTRL